MAAPKSFPFRLDFPPELPISSRAEEIVAALQANPVIVLAGETGSGKTTQIPKMCLAAGGGTRGRIACTQPRRVAALSVSRRVAEELGVAWGREVGCKVRFNDETSSATVIKFLTDGMLLAEVQGDPLLREYDTIIIDEAHERSLNIDFLLGHLRQLRFKRPELKIVITSATIDTEAFSKAFDGAPVIEVSGRTYPVEVVYAPLDELGSDTAEGDEPTAKAEALHYIDGAVEAVERILHQSSSGDILVFMPAERDIREARELLEGRRLGACEIVPLFGRLSNAEQQRVFAPSQRRKIVIATNIAETSLTIPGIHFVVDTGLARVSRYAAQARTRRLPIEEIAQSSADQRKGRCGRVAEGVCIRLYSEKDYLERPRFTQPEIQRANLADVILRMKAFGLGDIERFPFINMPAAKAVRAGYALLEELGAMENQRSEVRGQMPEVRDQKSEDARPKTRETLPTSDLRALSSDLWHLTALGRDLARLPVDPTVGRMILQARQEKCLREVLVIAAGLSIQDPRERPLDLREKADAAQRRFAHPDSDFLTLLAIWDAFHDEFETMSQSKLRRFCRDHFLSYTRMREWRDIHAQLLDVLSERDGFQITSVFDGAAASRQAAREKSPANRPKKGGPAPENEKMAWGTPSYRAIHRAILAGLLSNIGLRDDETGLYKATHDRKVALFPGSTLFARDESRRGNDKHREGPKKESKAPRWIMAAEIMETSRLYARTCARLDPLWALDLGDHLVKVSHSEPFWNPDGGRVLVKQRTRLYGLELETRAVSYGRIDPVAATEIFIREALVNDTVTWPFDFLDHNRRVRERVENLLTRARDSGYMNLDEAIYRFYASRLLDDLEAEVEARGVSSVAELVDLVRERKAGEPRFLMMEEADLRDPAELLQDVEAYPESLPLDNRALPLNYAYKPGQSDDGVTLDVNVREAESLNPQALDWAVPGHLPAKVEHYLRGAPKELRRAFVPLSETARSISESLRLTAAAGAKAPQTLAEAIAAELTRRYRIRVEPTWWSEKPLPEHLQVRVRVLDDDGKEICASRRLEEIRTALGERSRELSRTVGREDPDAWRKARARWEKPDQTAWTFGDVPQQVPVTDQAGVPVLAYPGLRAGGEGVALRLFRTPEEADAATRGGLQRLVELQLRYELAWLQKDLRALRELGALISTLVPLETLQSQAYDCLRRWMCDPARVLGRSDEANEAREFLVRASWFESAIVQAKSDLRGLVPKFVDRMREVLEVRQALLVHPQPYSGMERDLALLVPKDFLRTTPYRQLGHLARYLKAMRIRADRWRQNPAKDAERARQFAPYAAAAARWASAGPDELTAAQSSFRWLVEEFRVSVFAQELGTAEPVSPVKLDRALAETAKGDSGKAAPPPAPPAGRDPAKPPLAAPTAESRAKPLKSLGALDSLFRR
ncbi:ATP-dependent RNA helicase HrpA [Opitutaceae bacterium EW11]|nr:ATP-dependent RNA helicase HrpA [Opitutaceae bacterium EW11]